MARRTRTAAPAAVEPETTETTEEATSAKRGPSPLTMAFVQFLKREYDVDADPEIVYLAQTTRREFRDSDIYETYLEGEDKRKEEADAAKAKRAEEREAAKAVADAETPATDEAPKATRSRRGKAAAPAADVTETEAPVETTRTRSRRRGTEAPATEATTAAAAPAKAARGARAKAPF